MSGPSRDSETARLNPAERVLAGVAGVVLIGVALRLAVVPPQRRVALGQCPTAEAGCVVSVDGDLTVFATALAGVGAVAVLLGLLGMRFDRLKLGSAEFGFAEETEGLAHAAPAADGPVDGAGTNVAEPSTGEAPVRVDVRDGVGEHLHAVPVAVTRLSRPIRSVDPSFLRDYQSARKVSQHSHFLTHILGPATRPGQKYSVAIRVTPHRDADRAVRSASFYLGRAWGNATFEGRRGSDGRFGIATEAYGPFLALCEVEFDDGDRILLDHYCDFDMGSLLPT
jgi:hypothetical protein